MTSEFSGLLGLAMFADFVPLAQPPVRCVLLLFYIWLVQVP